MLLFLYYIEILARIRAELLVEYIEAEGIHALTEHRLVKFMRSFALTGHDETVHIALMDNGWSFYGDDETGQWQDDTLPSSLNNLRAGASFATPERNG